MKRLPQYNGGMRSNTYKYLIETPQCFAEALTEMIDDSGISSTARAYGMDDQPKDYPYIALMHPDDEYNRIDYAFVAMSDFIENSEAGSLAAMLAALYNDETMAPWIERIQDAQRNGDREVSFRDLDDEDNPDCQYAVNDHQIQYIRDKGYKVQWEKYPRSYIVSGW